MPRIARFVAPAALLAVLACVFPVAGGRAAVSRSRPITVPVDRPQSLRVRVPEAGEAVLSAGAAAPGTSWATKGRESTVLAVSVDGRATSDLVVSGSDAVPRTLQVGHVAAGIHTVSFAVAAERSPAAVAVQLWSPGVTIVADSRRDLDAVAARLAPIVYGRSLPELGDRYQNARTDAPLVAYHELLPAATAGHTVIQYTYVWSNEDGGTSTPALMARWGRTTDIEWVYAVEVDDATGVPIPGTATYQGAAHATSTFAGTDDGTHPILQTCTSNNNLCDTVTDPGLRFFLDTTEVLPPGQPREHVMDVHPWTYRVMSEELVREGKVESPADPATDAVSDPADYLYVSIDRDTSPATAAPFVGLAVRVVLHDGRVFESDHGHADWTVQRDVPAAIAVELPPGTTGADVAQIVARREGVYVEPAGATFDATSIGRAFFLGADHRPLPSFASYAGHTRLSATNPSALLWPQTQPVVVAHRGASGTRPEHTFASYDHAIELGTDFIEQDLHLTSDGVLVDIHDDTLDRTARGPTENCTGLVQTKTLAQLRTCDMGAWFGGGEYAGQSMPTMEELFQRYGHRVRYYIETKSPEQQPGMEDALLALMEQYGFTKPAEADRAILIQSFSSDSLIRIHQTNPRLPLIQLGYGGGSQVGVTQLDAVRQYAVGVGPPSGDVDRAYVAAAHERCLDVHPYTVNDDAEMTRLLDAGVDGMFTNYPDRLRTLLASRPPSPTHCR